MLETSARPWQPSLNGVQARRLHLNRNSREIQKWVPGCFSQKVNPRAKATGLRLRISNRTTQLPNQDHQDLHCLRPC